VHNSLGNALAAVQRGAEAVQSYHKALAIQPDSAEVRNFYRVNSYPAR